MQNPDPPQVNKFQMEKHLDLLGFEVKDKITDFTGIVESICFDLYGCIQADVRPRKLNKNGETQNGRWLDINRLTTVSNEPVMKRPDYNYGLIAEGKQGAADKPAKP